MYVKKFEYTRCVYIPIYIYALSIGTQTQRVHSNILTYTGLMSFSDLNEGLTYP